MKIPVAARPIGSDQPLLPVNGSWGDKHNEDPVVGPLAKSLASASNRHGHSACEDRLAGECVRGRG